MLAMNTGRRMGPSYGPTEGAASVRDALRALRESGLGTSTGEAPLETLRTPDQAPRLEAAAPIESDAIRVRALPDGPVEGFVAFLDGVQRSRVLAHAGSVPIVHGAVAAAVRERHARRPRTWHLPVISQALYAPLGLLDAALVRALGDRIPVRDTGREEQDAPALQHPQEHTARALTAVQRARESAELSLVGEWVQRGTGPLLVDGGISGSPEGAHSDLVVGVVKSHRTLYADAAALPLVLGLREGERTTAVRMRSPRRHPVASWYLRLREAAGRGPLFGLVRVEIAVPGDLTARADLVSRWLLAERTPVSLPDSRWDVMVYGVRECEQYLSAILR
jgi:hypothetical protein